MNSEEHEGAEQPDASDAEEDRAVAHHTLAASHSVTAAIAPATNTTIPDGSGTSCAGAASGPAETRSTGMASREGEPKRAGPVVLDPPGKSEETPVFADTNSFGPLVLTNAPVGIPISLCVVTLWHSTACTTG